MGIGVWQVVLVLMIVLIIFGAGKLPRVMGDVAKGIKNFKSGMNADGDADADANGTESSTKTIDAAETTTAAPAEKKDEEKV